MSHVIRINDNKIQITDLLKCLMQFEDYDKITPSRYMKEVGMSVEERLKFLNDRSRKQRIGRQNKLWTIPDIVVFQNFETHVKYSTVISFMHQKQHPVRIKVFFDLSPCFSMSELPQTVYSKLAPGTPHKMTLDFYSEEYRDYSSFVRFEADGDVVYLPIVALAPRPILIFPDIIEMPETVVNIASDKKVFMRNMGKSPVVFKLRADSPFSICPRTGIMEPNGVLDVQISYKSFKVGENSSDLVISFEGVDLYATLMCSVKNCEVYLNKTILYFEDTFLNLQRCISMNLVNNSEYTMKYQWKQFKTKYEDIRMCKEFCLKLGEVNEFEVLRNIQEENPNITDADLHRTFLQRMYDDELAEFDATDQFLFHDPTFKFSEPGGIIGPHSIANIEVIFCPKEAESYESIAYLDVTGRETRQPLKMVGTGLGPVVSLNFKVLDVENLYLCAKHEYEIVAKNESNIPATLTYCHKSMDFGGLMSCSPDEVFINPGKCEKMMLEFSSTMQGKFLENLNFRIAESGEYVSCVFQGNVVCPLLSYNIQAIDFGIVAFGFAVEKEISIQNTTEVPIEFRICILNDGTYEAITWVNFSRSHDATSVSKMPKEFSIYPDEATVAGNSSINIKITLVPNKPMKHSTFLHTYMWGSRKHYVELPIYYNCIVPVVECSPPRLDIRYCFINCPYDRMFTIKNVSEVPGYILYNETEENEGLSCKLSLTESYIDPGEEITIHLEIKGLQLGLHTKHLNFTVFGSQPADLCKLACDVQGPVICVNPEEIRFGLVPLLRWHSRKLYVMNDSPVPAFISIHVANPTFHVNPNEFKLEASEKLEVDISIYLTNVSKYSSILILNIVNSMDPLKVHLSAYGSGSCVLFEPILEPKYDLGTLMTHNSFKVPFKMTNMGNEMQRLFFSTVKNMKSMKEDTPSMKGYPFVIDPNLFDIQEKEQKIGYIDVYYTVPGPIDLMYYCYALDRTTKFDKVFEVKFTAHFEDPVLALSKPSLSFRMDVTEDRIESHLQENYTVVNESYLALDIYVNLNPPFYVLDELGSKTSTLNVNVASKTEFSFLVEFVPPIGVKKCLVSNGTMRIGFKLHPKIFSIPLTGDMHYPTLLTYPEAIKNQHIAPMAYCSRELIIRNISPLPVAYMYEWEVASYSLEKLSTPRYKQHPMEKCSTWNLERFDEISDKEFTVEDENINQVIGNLVGDDSKLPSLRIMYDILLKNLKFSRIEPEVSRKFLCLCKYFLFPITHDASDSEEDYLRILDGMPEREPDINEAMLNITPYQGCLQPYECCLINFYIRPPVQTLLKATAKCRILGGAEERIEISAVSGDIAYDIDKMSVYFGHQLFCELLEEQVTLTNTGHVGFEYMVLDDTNSNTRKSNLNSTIGLLTVNPTIGTLGPKESVSLQIKYFPGITGDFNESFVVDIGYLGPITIQVYGTAVYSQLYVMLPRPSLFEAADHYLCYTAIGHSSADLDNVHYNMKHIPEDVKMDYITTSILEQEDWCIVEHDDPHLPSSTDIDMAIERMTGYEYLQNNPQLLGERVSLRKKHFTIPNFTVPAYELSFGNVRRDREYEQDVSVYNYGPGICMVRLFIADKKYTESRGFFVTLNCQKIRLREFGNLNIKFRPDVKGADFTDPHICEVIYIEVNQGARIPIRMSASVGIPTTELSAHCMDFCGVIVGSCKRKTICLYNVGFVEAKWSCSVDTPIFFVRKKEGILAAGESEELQVFFEPKVKGPRQGILTFTVEGNGENLIAYLNGYGREPNFVIKESLVQFPPVLQYSPPLEESFVIQNTSSFPTEIFLSDYDRQIALHERICNVFWREKNAKKVYIARSLYGSVPSDIYRFLYKELLLDRLRKANSFTEVMKVSRTDIRSSSESVERLLDNLELRVDSSIAKRKPPQDIFMDPDIEDDKPAVQRTTKIIVFHGNKYTDYLKAANAASRSLQIPRYSLDGMIIDILVANKTAFTKEVNQIIDDAFMIRMDAEDCVCRESIIEDETDTLWRKLNAILSLEPVVKSKTGQPKKDGKEKPEKGDQMSMASSKMSRKTISTNTADTFQGIPEEMIIQILSDKIDQTDKMILDSLDSIFLPNVQIALKCFLKAAKDLTCIYFVFFTCTLEEHTTLVNEEELVNAAKEENRKQALHKKLLELDDYSSLTEEEREILMGIMEQKRRRSDVKRAELRGRIQDDLTINGRLQKVNSLKMFWAELDNSYLRGQAYSKLPSKSLKLPESHTHSMTLLTKDSKETKDSKSNKEKTSKKERRKDSPPVDDTAFYFYQFDIMLSEMLFLLENWNRKELMMEKSFPNFASLMASNRKDAKYTSKEFLKKTTGMRSKSLGAISMGIPENIDENENVVNTSFDPDVGYPAWLINQAHKKRSLNVIDPIIGLLKKMFTINCLTPTRRVCKETEVMYTVLTKPLPRKAKEKLDVFDLIKCEPRGESLRTEAPTPLQANDDETQNSKNSNTTLNVPSRRKAKRRKLTLTPTASDIEQISNIPVRFLLEPGYIQEITALFKPLYSGFFKYSYFFEVVGTYYKEKIVVQASCDYPKIDTSPYTLFPHHVQTIDSKTMFLNGVYVESQQILDFGTILLIPQHLLELRSSVSMLNISGMQCYISISFRTDSNVFFCDDDRMIIEIKPGRQHVLPIYAKPPAEGLFRETLLITIRDNPRVQEINLSCFACPLKFEVTPKIVNFNKVILGKTESEKIKLRNYTAVMVYFEFEIDITSEFRISIFNGYLDPCSSSEVTITFVPENIGDKKESLVLKIFDKEKQFPEPIQTEVLTLLAEVATFPLEYATSIDLGLVKGKISHFFPFTINNLGKYDVKILLTKPNQQSNNFMLGDYFKMKHMEYVVEGEKKYSNNCRFTCDKEMTFVDTPVVHVTILDNYRNSAIDHFTFKASARVTLSKFELCPHGEYFFGYQNVNTRRDSSLSLKNIGSFEFKYTIMTPTMIEEQSLRKLSKKEVEQTEENERESSIPSVTDSVSQPEAKKNVLKSTPESRKKGKLRSKSRSGTDLLSEVVAGIFTISPSTAIVQPGEAVSITITCHPTECQKYKETIIFFVSEPSYEDSKGRRLNLHVEGSEPRINFQDYRSMFPLQHVVKNIEDLPYIGDNFVFETSKKVLHFGKVSLHDSLSTKFRLWNTGHVTGTVFFDVVDKDCGFSIQSRVIDITPYNFEFNVIEFAPKAIGLWRGTLEMKCQDLSKSYEISCSINLIGEACMPTIEISEPDCSVNGESAPICFGPIPVHSYCERSVVLRNIGHVPCKVLAEIVGDPKWFLSLSMSTESGGDEKDFENDGMKHSDVVALKVGEKGYVKIKFEAKSATGSDCTLNLIVMNNCFDMWKLPLNTFAFLAPVCLEDLPVHPLANKRIAYSLNFGAVSKNELYKIRFKVKNMSDCIYKFVFGQIPELIFSPSVGHLYEGSEKTIIAAFRTKRHVDIKAKEILLTITEINLHPGHVFPLPWDDRQNPNIASLKSPSGDDSNENSGILSPINVVYESNEPPFDIIEVATVISLVVDAQCDYADYFCETREINFPPTNIQTMSSKTICIENRSNANLEVNWSITNYLDLLEKPTIPKPSLFEKLQISESEIPKLGVGEMEVFSIEPEEYTIPPQTKYDFKISFVPLDHKEHEYFLKANMKNLDPATTDLEIVVKGQSLNFPYLLNSPFMEDFDESDCRFKTYCGLFRGAETKILKFLSLGVGSECNRTVFITNNIHNPFSFVWKKIRTDSSKESFFHCEFSKGHLKPGKTTMTNFVFIPQKHGLFTDCFLFEPDEPYMPRSSLLLQGVCREPRVFFEQASLVVGVTLMNNVVEKDIILRNEEEMKIHFSFKKNSLYSDNQQLLNICPMTGLMESKSENKLRVTVRANKEGETIFSPNCVVQYMRETINFNLLMNVVDVSSRLIYFARELKKVEVKPKIPLTINLGVIVPHKLEEIKFELQNTSKVGFYYSWITEDKQSKTKTRFSREKGYLSSSENIFFTVTIVALRKCLLRNISLKLKILYGPTYVFKIEGSTQKPKFTFSFMKYDFGKCLIQTEPTKFYRTPLIFTNNNEWPVVLEFAKNNVPEFFIDFKSAEVESEGSRTIDIFFSPLQHSVYETSTHFFVNSTKMIIKLCGEGVPLNLEVLSLTDKYLDFGRVRVGKCIQKSVKILNNGESSVNVFFALQPKLPFNEKKIEKNVAEFTIEAARKPITPEDIQLDPKQTNKKKGKPIEKDEKSAVSKEDKPTKAGSKEKISKDNLRKRPSEKFSRSLIMKSLEKFYSDSEMQLVYSRESLNKFLCDSVEISPKKYVKIPPKKTVDVVIKLKPTEPYGKFQSNIHYKVQNFNEPIVTILGSAVDASFILNKDVINFGNVVVGYKSVESIILVNEGCIGGKFRWYLEKASSYVSFVGGDGYSPPNSKVATNIIFKPGHVQCIFKFKAYCQIENYKKRLELILTGGSMKLPPPSGTLELITPVREVCVGDIEFKNDTKETWETEPVITGSYFSGSTAFTVPKESIATYRISFNPMKMSPSQHKGTVFFPHPHGMNRLYALEGTVLPPKPIAEFNREICCKTYHSEILKVENWLGLRQHFKVIPEVLEGNTTMMIYKITSNDHIEVPPYGKRDFKWTIYVVNEGRLSFKVTFLNENTGEFLYYIITLKILPLEVNIENIEFVTCVRVPAIKEIIVNNPLPEAVDYAVTTSSPYVMVESSFFVLPYEKYCLKVKYMPVKIESSTALLTISNSTVGTYTYNLILEAQAPNSEPEVKFRTQLGQSEVKNIYVPRLLQNSELVAEIKENASFEVGKIQSQSDKPYVEVMFLPSDIGLTRAALLVSSVVGDYTYPLFGECMHPEPQGPFVVHLGESISFEIYNPFEDTRTFKFTVDNSVFQVKPPEESIRAKKSTKITVLTSEKRLSKIGSGTLLSALGKGGQLNAKLTVSCENDLNWIYYLQCNSSNK